MNKDYWWISTGVPEKEHLSAEVRVSVAKKGYGEIKKGVWSLYRSRTDRRDINSRDKMMLWAISEKYDARSMSCSYPISYLSKMIGVSRKTGGKAVERLVEANIIWIVSPGVEKKGYKKLEGGTRVKKNFILVGLSHELSQ